MPEVAAVKPETMFEPEPPFLHVPVLVADAVAGLPKLNIVILPAVCFIPGKVNPNPAFSDDAAENV